MFITGIYGFCSEKTRERLQYLLEAKIFMCVAASMISAILLFTIIFCQFLVVPYWLACQQVISILAIFTTLLFIQRMCVLMIGLSKFITIAIDFHMQTYQARIEKSKAAIAILDNLRESISTLSLNDFFNLNPKNLIGGIRKVVMRSRTPSASSISESSKQLPGIKSQKSPVERLKEGNTDGLRDQSAAKVLKSIPQIGGWSRVSLDLLSDTNATQLAKKLFKALLASEYTMGSSPVTIESFRRYFALKEECEAAFQLFDTDGNGTIGQNEMIHAVSTIYRERRHLLKSLGDISDALGVLNKILYIFTAVATFFFSLPILGISLSQILPIISLLLALSFVFGGSASTTFNCIIFLFVSHPFDAGDRVNIDGENYVVEKFNLLNTVLVRSDGRKVFTPNGRIGFKNSCPVNKIHSKYPSIRRSIRNDSLPYRVPN